MKTIIQIFYSVLFKYFLAPSTFNDLFVHNRHFFPFRRVDITPSASLWPIRSEEPQLHGPRLASTATSTREYNILHINYS